jgi:HAMP domain-containing protein
MELKNVRKFMIVFGSVVLVLVVTAFFSAGNLNRSTQLTIDLIGLQEVNQASKNIVTALDDERISIGQYQLSGDEELLTRIGDAQADYDQNWNVIVENLGTEQTQSVADIESTRETYSGMLDDLISEYQSNPNNNRSGEILRDAINYYLQYVNPGFTSLIEPEIEELARLTEIERANVQRNSFVAQTVLVLSVLVGIASVLVVLMALIFSTRLMNSMTSIIDATNAISRGDLDIPIEINQAGEIGELAKAIDRMRTSLKAAIERLRR